jgi:Domain of unknown function (DUF4382)
MKNFHKLIVLALSLTIMTLISGCGGGGTTSASTGVLSLSMTDAPPKLGDDVTEVNIAVIGIEYNHDGNWTNADDFEPQTFNLLDLQNGKSLHLGDMILPAGHYTEIRFILAAPEKESDVKSNPDCNITFEDGTSVPLFVPSGGQSGYKGKGEFDITANAKVEVTADFDVQKSIVVTGNRKYLLKPVIRLVVTELSGVINGTVVDVADYNTTTDSLVVYTYTSGTYDVSEEDEVDGIIFPNAVSSADVNMSDGNFTLSFLGEGNYSLITAQYLGDTFAAVVDVENNVEVFNGQSTLVDINTSN